MIDSGTTLLLLPDAIWHAFWTHVIDRCHDGAELIEAFKNGHCAQLTPVSRVRGPGLQFGTPAAFTTR